MNSFIDKSQPPETERPEPQPIQAPQAQAPEAALLDEAPNLRRDPTHSNAIAAMSAAASKIPGDVVNRATADLPDNQRSAIRRLHQYYIENDLSLDELGKLVHKSGTTLGLIFRAKYGAKLDDVVSEIDTFFNLMDKRGLGRKLPFIETGLTRRIWQICEAAIEFQRIAFLFGDQQIGKTEALLQYQATHNHGNTIYCAVPTGGVLTHFLVKLAECLRLSPSLNKDALRRRIIDSFDDRMLLIVDEAHQAIPEAGMGKSVGKIQTIEFVREIFNERHCGVVICATNVFRDAMEKGPVEKILRQTKRRRLLTFQCPSIPCQADLNIFAAAYGLPPSTGQAREMESRIVDQEALGMWLSHLRMAAKLAAKTKQTMEWAHVISAHAALVALANADKN